MSELVLTSLAECEDVIERGLATFVDVGQALLHIRAEHLYRETHPTFEDYCRQRWGFTDEYARLQMRASEKATTPTIVGLPPLPSEAVARVLPSEPDRLRETWGATVERHGPQPTAAQVRDVIDGRSRGQLANQAGGTDEWATPQDFFDIVNAEFGFDLDVCALPTSAKCERYFTPEHDGLAQNWTGTCWMNPPYGNEISQWVGKAWESAQAGATVACLVPARVDTGWWWDYCRFGEIRFLRGRLRFGDAEAGAPFPSALVIFGREPKVVWWER